MLLETLAILSGVLQAAGYFFYIRFAVKNGSVPNPLSWLMFAYGTLLLLLLEMDRNASWQLLTLPTVCAASSMVVVYLCWKRGGFKKPLDFTDSLAFAMDIILTICYMAAWMLMSRGVITSGQRQIANLVILVCWNAGIFTAFMPIAREVKSHPDHEHPLPWTLWALAYTTLLAATLAENGTEHLEFLLYPGINAGVHGAMAWMSRKTRGGRSKSDLPIRRPL